MRIIHRVCLPDEVDVREFLESRGVPFNGSDGEVVRMIWLDIDESHEKWPDIAGLIGRRDGSDIPRTSFTADDYAHADSMEMSPSWHHGYPQPEKDFGYLNETYDLKEFCRACGIGKTQIGPFYIKGEPKWGKKHILQLNWVFDEYFVLPAVWDNVFRPAGVGCRDVLDYKTRKELKTVVQLEITQVSKAPLAVDETFQFETCGSCGRKKYLPITRGFFPGFAAGSLRGVCKTEEYFGSGPSAWNAIVVAKAVYEQIIENKLSGVTFVPMRMPQQAQTR